MANNGIKGTTTRDIDIFGIKEKDRQAYICLCINVYRKTECFI